MKAKYINLLFNNYKYWTAKAGGYAKAYINADATKKNIYKIKLNLCNYQKYRYFEKWADLAGIDINKIPKYSI